MNALTQRSQLDNRRMLWLEVTNFCNLACAHCYNSSGSHESLTPSVTPERYEQILDEARDLGFRGVQFIGGEPLFYPHLQRLVDRAMSLKFRFVEIYSNLTILPAWLLESRYRGIHLATSFYSDDPKVHDAICGAERSFDRTVQSIRRVIKAGLALRVGVVEMKLNEGRFDRTRAFLHDLGVEVVGRDFVRRFGRGSHGAEPTMSQLCGRCADGNLCVDVNGAVSACIMSKPWSLGNIRDADLAAIFESDERRRFVEDLHRLRKRIDPVACEPDCRPVTECNPNCQPSSDCRPTTPEDEEEVRRIEESSCDPDCRPVTECNPNCQPSEDCRPTRLEIEREIEEDVRRIEESSCGPDCRPVTECNPNCQPSEDCRPTRLEIEREIEEDVRRIEESSCDPDCRPVTECNPNCQPSVDCVPTRREIEREIEEVERETEKRPRHPDRRP